MHLSDSFLENEFRALKKAIESELRRYRRIDVSVRAIQILCPDSFPFRQLTRFLFCSSEDREPFIKLTNDYVFDRAARARRSLYFLRFPEPYRYKSYSRPSARSAKAQRLKLSPKEVDRSENPPVRLTARQQRALSRPKNLETFWSDWLSCLKTGKFGNSCMWTYILDRHDEPTINTLSALIVFEGVMNKRGDANLLSTLSKRTQDTLVKILEALLHGELAERTTRSAISQVMARNMSHNIGSHVLSKFKTPEDFNGIFGFDLDEVKVGPGNTLTLNKDGRILFNSDRISTTPEQFKGTEGTTNGISYSGITRESSIRKGGAEALTELSQVAYFNEYLKNRMDFLADVATADPTMESPMFLYSEILKGFDRNRILLNRISGISTDDFSFQLVPRIKIADKFEHLVGKNDIQISSTNDILGAQAFYIILENIIRNIAKHGKLTRKGPISIYIDILDYESDPSYYEVRVYDDIETDNIDNIVRDRNNSFNTSILNEDGTNLRPAELGTIEMAVCAAYMRRLPLTACEDRRFRLNFSGMDEKVLRDLISDHAKRIKKQIKQARVGKVINEFPTSNNLTAYPKLILAFADRIEENNKKGHLGYKFYFRKPEEVLVVVRCNPEDFKIKFACTPKDLLARGIRVVTFEDLKSELENSSSRFFNHQILHFHGFAANPFEPTELKKLQGRLPKRTVISSDDSIRADADDVNDFKRMLWERHATALIPKGKTLRFLNSANKPLIKKHGVGFQIKDEYRVKGSDPLFNIFIDNHDGNWDKRETENFSFYDMACGHSRVKKFNKKLNTQILKSERKDKDKEATDFDPGYYFSRYIENVFTKILVIDERVQESIANLDNPRKYAGRVDLREYLEQQGLIIPCRGGSSKGPDLNQPTFDGKFKKSLKTFIKDNKRGTRFLLIHLGILEKLLPSGKGKDPEEIRRLLDELLGANSRIEPVITSGRGEPENVPDGVSYIPLAPVQNAIETMFDKLLLTTLLYNSRERQRVDGTDNSLLRFR